VPGGILGQLLYPITGSVEGFLQHWTK
jgi:hypothetical protein